MILSDGEVRAMSALALAHMGDAVYEILARREALPLRETDRR